MIRHLKRILKPFVKNLLSGRVYSVDPVAYTHSAVLNFLLDNDRSNLSALYKKIIHKAPTPDFYKLVENNFHSPDLDLFLYYENKFHMELNRLNNEKNLKGLRSLYILCYFIGFFRIIPEGHRYLSKMVEDKGLVNKDPDFERNALLEQKVILIGPSDICLPSLKGSDIAYLGRQKLKHNQGNKQLVYVNEMYSQKISEHELIDARQSKIFYIFKKFKPGNNVLQIFKREGLAREAFTIPRFKVGHPNLLPVALCDLINQGYRDIYVTGCNFYLSSNIYRLDYKDPYVENENSHLTIQDKLKLFETFCGHDLLSQVLFVQSLSEVANITGDEMFQKAVSYNPNQYMDALFTTYFYELSKLLEVKSVN